MSLTLYKIVVKLFYGYLEEYVEIKLEHFLHRIIFIDI